MEDSSGDLPLVPGGSSSGTLKERVPGSQHALMSAAMLDAKRARMKVENDREALANRIARLQNEELRATKRIEQTHRRTQEILAAKNRHHQQQSEKEKIRIEHEELVEAHRQALSHIRDERKQATQTARATHAAQRQAVGKSNKESMLKNAEIIAQQRAAELNAAMYKRNEVRKVEADARERKLREKELMIAHLQKRAEERQLEETRRAEAYDKDLAELERQEYELLVALEGHRNDRQEVYAELESQLGHAPSQQQLRAGGPAAMA
jgi:hypothetical protein